MTNLILKCIIIDDEAAALELIEKYISKVPFLKLVSSCSNASIGLSQINILQPDVVFLDIKMPEINGFELLHLLPTERPSIIMITANPFYALEGFEHQVTDYLLKPVSFDRFMRAVNKVLNERNSRLIYANPTASSLACSPNNNSTSEKDNLTKYLFIKTSKKHIRLTLKDIYLIEALKDYLKIYWNNQVSIIHLTMTKIEELLPKSLFSRVHRSFIVNREQIIEIERNKITVGNGKKVPIGVTYKNDILIVLKKKKFII